RGLLPLRLCGQRRRRARTGLAPREAGEPDAASSVFRRETADDHAVRRRRPAIAWLELIAALVAGSIPFAALGLAIGSVAGPNSAPAIVNLVYLPLSFLSGLWIPVEALPPVVAHIAAYLPTYHLGQPALGTVGAGHGSALSHIAILALWTVVGAAAAAYGMKRDEG